MNEPINPYASPTMIPSFEMPILQDTTPTPASRGLRFANFLIDYVVQIVLSFGVGILIVLIGGQAGADLIEEIPGIFFGVPILVGYYWLFEVTTGRTIGKLITGTKVVNRIGGQPSLGQITGRTFARMIPFEAFSFFGTPTRGWHDSLTNTYVVKIGNTP